MTTDSEMRRLAETAPDGPWIEDPDEPGVVMRPDRPGGWDGEMVAVASGDFYRVNAAFIAAANPQWAREVLDRVADAEAEAVAASVAHHEAEAEVEMYHGRWSDAMKSAEDLRANYEQVRQMNAAQVETITALRAEIDDLRETLDDFRAVLDEGGDDA